MTQLGQPRTAVVLGPGEGLDVSRRNGRDSVLKVTGTDTAGHLAILEVAHPQGVPGPPLHIHPNTEEAFYVLAGQLRVRAGEHEHTLSAGGFILVPQGLPHTFTTAGTEPARFLTVHSPAGFEQFSIDVADAERRLGRELGPAELVPLASRQDWQFAGPPLSV
jgi:mannose-6-phosphate isomerase-like protein (cupin superfamily)